MSHDLEDSKNAIKQRNAHQQIKEETAYVVQCYLAHHHLKKDKLITEDENFIVNEVNRLKYLRSTATYEDYTNELEYTPEPELPARLAKQLSKFYESLLSLDDNYDKKRAKRIVQRVVDGSGDPTLVKVLEFLKPRYSDYRKINTSKNEPFTITSLVKEIGLGTGTIKKRLELLVGLKFLKKELKSPGEQGGRPGYQYFISDEKSEDEWNILLGRTTISERFNTGALDNKLERDKIVI